MKILKIISLVLLSIIILCGLTILVHYSNTPNYSNIKVDNLHELTYWIYRNIKYIPDNGDYWQYPEETLDRMGGDCEDMVILFRDIALKKFNKDVLIIFFLNKNFEGHVTAYSNRIIYDPTWGDINYINNYCYYYQVAFLDIYNQQDLNIMMEYKR